MMRRQHHTALGTPKALADDSEESGRNEESFKNSSPSSLRRRCLTCCLCATLISIKVPKGVASDDMNKVCRNCSGSGAIICKLVDLD